MSIGGQFPKREKNENTGEKIIFMHSQENFTHAAAGTISDLSPQLMLTRFPEPMDPELVPTTTLDVLPTLSPAFRPPVELQALTERIQN